MSEVFNWIDFKAHTRRIEDPEEEHPDFFGVFICPKSRREPEQLLVEVLGNRKLFLTDVTNVRLASDGDDWGMRERLKQQIAQQGYAISIIKIQAGAIPAD